MVSRLLENYRFPELINSEVAPSVPVSLQVLNCLIILWIENACLINWNVSSSQIPKIWPHAQLGKKHKGRGVGGLFCWFAVVFFWLGFGIGFCFSYNFVLVFRRRVYRVKLQCLLL